jgi:serine/threonine protein phosphatase 1
MVFKRLFGLKRETTPRRWAAPIGQRIYAIGDIHGRRDLLDSLLEKIERDDCDRPRSDTKLIFLGDLVDRGADSKGVVERLMALRDASPDVRFLMGNHEELLILAYEGDRRATGLFNRVGGRETLLSYGISAEAYDEADLEQLSLLIADHIPASHIDFLRSFEDWIQAGDYLFVHAGIRPGYSIEEQEPSDIRWIRKEFTQNTDDHGVMVVHGHSIVEEIDVQANRIGIDTGAYATDRLTAIGIEGAETWFIQTESQIISRTTS